MRYLVYGTNTYHLYKWKSKKIRIQYFDVSLIAMVDNYFVQYLPIAPHGQRESNAGPKDAVVVPMKRTFSVRSSTPIMF